MCETEKIPAELTESARRRGTRPPAAATARSSRVGVDDDDGHEKRRQDNDAQLHRVVSSKRVFALNLEFEIRSRLGKCFLLAQRFFKTAIKVKNFSRLMFRSTQHSL